MAIANKLTKDELKLLGQALKAIYQSAERSAKSAKSDTIKAAFETEMARINALAVKVHNGELDL